eukprot:6547958-Pyramimonas_sp.AAC.1
MHDLFPVKKKRRSLLAERMRLRVDAVDSGTNERLEEVKEEPANSQNVHRRRRNDLACENNDPGEMRRLRIECQRNGGGPKK